MVSAQNYIGFRALLPDCKFLTRDEEREHFRRWREDGNRESQEILFRSVAPFMLTVVARFCQRHNKLNDIEEYESLACEGVLRSMEKWNASMRCRLGTYTAWHIWQRMQRGLADHQLIRVPAPLLSNATDSRAKRYRAKYAREVACARRIQGISASHDGNDEASWAASREPEPFDRIDVAEETERQQRLFLEAMDMLPERLRQVIIARTYEQRTLKEIGEEIGLTKERVRQMEVKAKKLMRQYVSAA